MNINRFCRGFRNDEHPGECKYLRYPMFHAGYTGKSGLDASFYCKFHKKKVSEVKKCEAYETGVRDEYK